MQTGTMDMFGIFCLFSCYHAASQHVTTQVAPPYIDVQPTINVHHART